MDYGTFSLGSSIIYGSFSQEKITIYFVFFTLKSRIRETLTLLTDADSRTDTNLKRLRDLSFLICWKKIVQPLQNCIGPTIRIGREILCLPYAGFFCCCCSYQDQLSVIVGSFST